MGDHEHTENAASEPRRPWQFGMIHLLAFPALLGLVLGFIIGCYPYSVMMLPFGIVIAIVTLALSMDPAVGFRSRGALVVVSFVIYVLITLLGPGFIDLKEYGRRMTCANNLKQITVALHNYHEQYGNFPPAYIADQNGKPMHSWRVLILPLMEGRALYARYRFDEPWDGPNNSKLANTRVWAYTCPEQNAAGSSFMTSYVAVVGPGTVWPGTTAARVVDIRDGTSNTLMVVEVADSGIHWMEPRDLDAATMAATVNSKDGLGISSLHCDPGWYKQRLGANIGMADGSVVFLQTSTPETKVRALVTAAGGEPIARDREGPMQ